MTKRHYDLIMGAIRERISYFEKREVSLNEGYDGAAANALVEAGQALEERFKNESFN